MPAFFAGDAADAALVVGANVDSFYQPPTFKTLIGLSSGDMISFYEKARLLAENFSYIYGKDYHRKLVEAL